MMRSSRRSQLDSVTMSFLLMMLVSAGNVVVGNAAFPDSYVLGVKAGDWIEYNYSHQGETVDNFLRVVIVGVEGPPRVSMTISKEYYVNWPNYNSETLTADYPIVPTVKDNVAIGFAIPADSAVGDTVITGYSSQFYVNHRGITTILDESTESYAGAMRPVLHIHFSVLGTDWDKYYDKQTGFLVREIRSTALLGVETTAAVRTNMWGELETAQTSITNTYYIDKLPSEIGSLLDRFLGVRITEAAGFEDVAVAGEFHTTIAPLGSVKDAKVEVVADYVNPGDTTVQQEIIYFPLYLKGNEFVGNILLSTKWPYDIFDAVTVLIAGALLGTKEIVQSLAEKFAEATALPEVRTYIGTEHIYVDTKATRIIVTEITGQASAFVKEIQIPLKTSYQKIADWGTGKNNFWVETLSPVGLSVVDESGNRFGVFQNQSYQQIASGHYKGRTGMPQLIIIEEPSGEYIIDVEGTGQGDYTLLAGFNVAGNQTQFVLANDSILLGTVRSYPVTIMESVNDANHTVYIVLGVAAVVTAVVTGLAIKRKKEKTAK